MRASSREPSTSIGSTKVDAVHTYIHPLLLLLLLLMTMLNWIVFVGEDVMSVDGRRSMNVMKLFHVAGDLILRKSTSVNPYVLSSLSLSPRLLSCLSVSSPLPSSAVTFLFHLCFIMLLVEEELSSIITRLVPCFYVCAQTLVLRRRRWAADADRGGQMDADLLETHL